MFKALPSVVAGCLLALAFIVAYGLITPQIEGARRESINKRVADLRDRARGHPPDKQALMALVNLLRSSNSFTRTSAALQLGRVGRQAEPATEALVATLEDGDGFAAREAARSLGKIGPGARAAIPALIQCVRTSQDRDRGWFAARSLGLIASPDDPSVIEVLRQASSSSNELMMESAKEGLQLLESRRLGKPVPDTSESP